MLFEPYIALQPANHGSALAMRDMRLGFATHAGAGRDNVSLIVHRDILDRVSAGLLRFRFMTGCYQAFILVCPSAAEDRYLAVIFTTSLTITCASSWPTRCRCGRRDKMTVHEPLSINDFVWDSPPPWSTDEFQLLGLGAQSALQDMGPGLAWVQETVGHGGPTNDEQSHAQSKTSERASGPPCNHFGALN